MWMANLVYDSFMFPFEKGGLAAMRKMLLAQASGSVLEIGAGSGVNVQYLPVQRLRSYLVLDREQLDLPVRPAEAVNLPFFGGVQGDVQCLPFAAETFDTVICTLLFCSVANPVLGLQEVHRVLKPEGTFLFIEHVLPEKRPLACLFDKLTPFWKKMAKGCHLNRQTVVLIREAGFSLTLSSSWAGKIFVAGAATKI